MRLRLCMLFSVAYFGLLAQQPGQYSLYFLDPVQFNPAYAGLDNSLSVTGTIRSQWTNLVGAPSGQRLSAHLPIYRLSSGFGIEVEQEELGARQYTRVGLSYNYQLVTGRSIWSFGISARVRQLQLDGSILRTPEGSYEEGGPIIHNDDLLGTGLFNANQYTFGAGIYYQSDKFEGGISAQNLNAPALELEALTWSVRPMYTLYGRLRLEAFSDWVLYPSVMARSDGLQTQAEISAIMQKNDNIFVGLSFRGYDALSSDAVIISAGLNVSPKLSIAYAHDVSISGIRSVHDGSHEFVVKYNLRQRIGDGVPPPIIYYPRTKE
ncbi:MAG: PorP/SprF family type IX secretion system membrane protein [Bacteroidota bacterium]